MTLQPRKSDCLVIADCHGHYDRLEALLLQEGILGEPTDAMDRPRINHDVEVIQLGDLGHFGKDNSSGDRMLYEAVLEEKWADLVLWGNHDRAVVDGYHAFSGFIPPDPMVRMTMKDLEDEGRMKMAVARHGFLLTHAGLHPHFVKNLPKDIRIPGDDVEATVDFLNQAPADKHPAINAISRWRGGGSAVGGILWRDAKEKLYRGFPQVFGHSSYPPRVRRYETHSGLTSYCIDTGNRDNGCLVGIWLPECKLVSVELQPNIVGYPLSGILPKDVQLDL